MKKIYYSFTAGLVLGGLALVVLLGGGCTKVNDQFDTQGLDSLTSIRNETSYEYTLATSDYKTIGTLVQKPITDAITALNDSIAKQDAALTIAPTHSDSLAIQAKIAAFNANIAALKLDPYFVLGGAITSEKYLPLEYVVAPEYVAAILNKKYMFADEPSDVLVTYNTEYDTTSITNKATLTVPNYNVMGTGTGQPGKDDYFSSSVNPAYFIPIFLKQNFPYSLVGDVRLIRYKYHVSSSSEPQRWMVLVYDGTTWVTYGKLTPAKAKFVIKNRTWKYTNNDILVGLNTSIGSNLGDFTAISVVGDQVWSWNSYNYMTITGFVTPNYIDNEDWLVSPAMDLSERGDSTFLTFAHTGKYFGSDFIAGAKKQATVWISYTSDGVTINPSDWTQITFSDSDYNFVPGWVWVTVKPVKLTAYAGKSNVRIAFKYLSLTSEGYAGTYELKKVYVYEKE